MADTVSNLSVKAVLDIGDFLANTNTAGGAVEKVANRFTAAGSNIVSSVGEVNKTTAVGATFHANTTPATDAINRLRNETKRAGDDAAKDAPKLTDLFGKVRDSVAGVIGQLSAGNIPGAIGAGTKSVGELASTFSAAAGTAGVWGAGIVGAVVAVGAAARAVSNGVNEQIKLSQRLGSSVQDTGTLSRSLDRGGVEDPEAVLGKFSRALGEIRSDINGPTAQALRRLRLDPEAVAAKPMVDAFGDVVTALGGVNNAFDRASIAQHLLGKSWQDIAEVVRQGRAGLARAAEEEERFGPGAATVERARHATQEWREVSRTANGVWGNISSAGRATGTLISDIFATNINGASRGLENLVALITRADIQEIPTLGANTPAPTPLSQGAVTTDRDLQVFRQRREQNASLRSDAESLGIASAASTTAEVESVRDLVEWRGRLIQSLREQGGTEDEIAQRTTTANAEVTAEFRRRQDAQRAADREAVTALERRTATDSSLATQAVAAGLAPITASMQELQRVRPLLDQIKQASDRPNSSAAEVADIQDRLARVAQQQRNTGAEQAAADIERQNRLRRMQDIDGLSASAAQRRLDNENGINQAYAERLERGRRENEQLEQRRAIVESFRTTQDRFERSAADIGANPTLTGAERTRGLGAAFLQLEQQFRLPASLVATGVDAGSIEAARIAADFRIRENTGLNNQDPQERVRRVLELGNQQRERLIKAQEETGRAVARLVGVAEDNAGVGNAEVRP